mmetsp:Transcript_28804/g.32281  ORF Transcript_28804/g.32281 Transcript_28804/m.32281 type:complete len:83 (+) Transcript_28804:691-939(+)
MRCRFTGATFDPKYLSSASLCFKSTSLVLDIGIVISFLAASDVIMMVNFTISSSFGDGLSSILFLFNVYSQTKSRSGYRQQY